MLDIIEARGHPNILCTHETTIEVTKDFHLTKRGNCILGIKASKACNDMNEKLKKAIWNGNKINVIIKVGELKEIFSGYGHKNLPLTNTKDIVFRKSNYICDRTALIKCNKSSQDLNRQFLKKLNKTETTFHLIFNLAVSTDNE